MTVCRGRSPLPPALGDHIDVGVGSGSLHGQHKKKKKGGRRGSNQVDRARRDLSGGDSWGKKKKDGSVRKPEELRVGVFLGGMS